MMAEEKKIPKADIEAERKASSEVLSAAEGTEGAQASASLGNENTAELELAERLKEAEGNIDRHHEDVLARKTEQEKNREKAESENKARMEEDAKAREERAKQARLVAEQKLAAYEYAHNYRKKLKKDKERAKSQAKLRQEEERAAAKEREREEKALEIARALEEERAAAEARNERVTALLERIKNGALEQTPTELSPAPELPAEETLVAELSTEEAVAEDAPAEEAGAAENIPPLTSDEEESDEVEDESFILDFVNEGDEDGNDTHFVLDNPEELATYRTEKTPEKKKPAPMSAPKTEESKAAPEKKEEPAVKRPAPKAAEPEVIPPINVEDDIVAFIKALGKTVDDDKALKKYLKKSKKAIEKFREKIKRTEKYIAKCADDTSLPELTVDTVTNYAKIVEIRCDNVSTCARMSAEKHTKKCAAALSVDIEDYNSKVAVFNSFTGEHLTRISAFLPEHLANKTGRALIPKLAYRDNYIEIDVDENGAPLHESGNVTTVIVSPPFTASDLLGEISVDSRGEANSYYKKAARARHRFNSEISCIEKQIRKTAEAAEKNLCAEKDAEAARESAIRALNSKYPKSSRKESKYTKKLSSINNKCEKAILKARRERTEEAYEQKSLRLLVDSFAVEREKIVAFQDLIREIRTTAKDKSLLAAKRDFVEEMRSYNARSKECSEAIGKPLSLLSGSLADSIARSGDVYPIPKMACRKELIETVGDNSRIVGDRIKTLAHDGPIPTKQSSSGENLFDKDKSLEERALLREQIMVKALEQRSTSLEDKKGYGKYLKKSKYTVRKLKKTIRQTNKAIFKATDKNGVIAALVENLRVQGKLVEARCINLETAVKVGARNSKLQDRLYDDIEMYNSRAMDYQRISANKLTRMSAFLPENISNGTGEATVPSLSYKETYIEAYPFDNKAASVESEYGRRGADLYLPIDYKYRRITENGNVEVTEITPPITADERLDRIIVDTRREMRDNRWQSVFALWTIDRSLNRAERRQKRNNRRAKRFDKKLKRLNKRYDSSLFKMESLVPELQRQSPEYRAKLDRAAEKYKRATVKLRYKRVKRAIERYGMKLAAEEFVLRRERVAVLMKKLLNLRTYYKPKPIRDAKNDLVEEIRDYNRHAREFSKIIGEPITEISASVIDEIVRNGKMFPLPRIILCREIVETVDGRSRIIGDKYRFGMPVQINAQGLPIMTGTNIVVENVGSTHIGLRSDGCPVIGSTDTGLPYAGAPDKSITVTARRNPAAMRAASFSTSAPLPDPLEQLSSETETVVAGEVGELDKYIGGAVKAKSCAVCNWRDLIKYMKKSRKAKSRITDISRKHRRALRKCEQLLDRRERAVNEISADELLRLTQNRDDAQARIDERILRLESIDIEIEEAKKARDRATRRELEDERDTLRNADRRLDRELWSAERELASYEERVNAITSERDRVLHIRDLLYLRRVSALGRIIELECMNLYAAAKIQAGFFAKLILLIRGCGFNPRNKAKSRLENDITKYNNIIFDDPAEPQRAFTPISAMLPEQIATREDIDGELIPDIIFKERFVSVDAESREGHFEEIIVPRLPDLLDIDVIRSKDNYNDYMDSYNALCDDVDDAKNRVKRDADGDQDSLEKIRRKKQKATACYERAVLKISRKTHGTVEYQRKMRRRLNRYRKRILKLNRRERHPRIKVNKWMLNYKGHNDQGLIYGLSGNIRRACAAQLVLERERLLAACQLMLKVRDAEVSDRKRTKYRNEASKKLGTAMAKYNRAADECYARIHERMWYAPSSLPATIMNKGIVPNIPKVMCSVQTFEALGNDRSRIDKATDDAFPQGRQNQ